MQEILTKLDERGVPGSGITWERILEFATNFNKYPELGDALEIETTFELSEHQQRAWDKINTWLDSGETFFALRGYAGAGKSYLLSLLAKQEKNIFFAAPTNKATKVLAKFVKVPCRTIYSLLGIRMTQEEDTLKLTFAAAPPYFPKNSIIVIDESSMVGKELLDFIVETVKRVKCRVLFVGDPAQLPPVGEPRTRAWDLAKSHNRTFMKQVIRYDNQLLSLATNIRNNLSDKEYFSPVVDDNDGREGVFLLPNKAKFVTSLRRYNDPLDFATTKVIAWRNKTVDYYTDVIRENLGFKKRFCVGDVVLIADQVEKDGDIIATIDDEFVVESVDDGLVSVEEGGSLYDIKVWQLGLTDDTGSSIIANIPYDDTLQRLLNHKANKAKSAKGGERKDLWKDFWETKNKFQNVRYGYAITAHRAQGSTYQTVYIDQADIMANQNKREALRCLYVAATRPTTKIITY